MDAETKTAVLEVVEILMRRMADIEARLAALEARLPRAEEAR